MVETIATPSNAPAASSVPPAAAKIGDSSLPQCESQPEKPKRLPKQVARKFVRPYKTWTSSSSSSKESPPPVVFPPPAASVSASTPVGPSTRTRAQQASVEKELRSSRSHDKPAPPAKKKLKTNPPSVSSSSEEEEPMEVSSDKSISLHSEKEIPEDIGVSSDSEGTELEPEPPLTKSAPTPARSSSPAKASAAAKGKKPTFKLVFPNLIFKVLSSQKNVTQSHETLEPSLSGTTFQPSEYFDGVFQKGPKAGVAAAAVASSSSAAVEIQEVKNEVQLVNNRLAAMEEIQQEMSKQLSTLVKLYRD
ncbi:hypothetical protein CsatB_014958 [Cannabis sativa]